MLHLLFSFLITGILLSGVGVARAQSPRLYLSEIMHSPVAPEPEWIELWNDEDADRNLDSISISDLTKEVYLSHGTIPARGYIVVTKDSASLRQARSGNFAIIQAALPSLSNSNDVVVLRYGGSTLDSVHYSSAMGGTAGTSLERISFGQPASDTSNWATSNSTDGATPGGPNQPRIHVHYRVGAVVISEIMAAPASPEPEWLEMYNTTDSTIDLNGWKLVNGKTSHSLISTRAVLAPAQWLLLTSNDTLLASSRTLDVTRVVRMTIGTLSNSGGHLKLETPEAEIIDSVAYPALRKNGLSLERFDLASTGDSANWLTCRAYDGATPLASNSWVRRQLDLCPTEVTFESDSIVIHVRNLGQSPIHNFVVGYSSRLSSDSMRIQSELASGDSTLVRFPQLAKQYGLQPVHAWTYFAQDQESSNDSIDGSVLTPIPNDSLSITEIMFRPEVGSCEWIEMYNSSSRTVALDSCRFQRRSASTAFTARFRPFEIEPKTLGLIAADGRFFVRYPALASRTEVLNLSSTLNLVDDTAVVSLLDSRDTLLATARYDRDWFATPAGASLELRSIGKTFDSADVMNRFGGTPLLLPGTDTTKSSGTQLFTVSVSPNPYCITCAPTSYCTITVGVGEETSVTARLFDLSGNLVRVLAAEVQGPRSLSFDGKDEQGRVISPGLYVLQVVAGSGLKQLGLVIAPPR